MADTIESEIAQITFYLAKQDTTFDSILDDEAGLDGKLAIRKTDFEVDDAECRFIYFEIYSERTNPPWLDFVNEKVEGGAPFAFADASRSPNGILLLETEDRVFAAVFGRSAASCLNRKMLEPDFGIKTAMNMCGNEEIRQTRTQSNAITPTHIDRQASRPSDSFVFGLSEAEDLRYISAHIKGQKNTTLQGRDNLTVKVIGEEKRIAQDDTANANNDLIEHAYRMGYLYSEKEYRFLLQTARKRILSQAQLDWKRKINRRILAQTIVQRRTKR